MKDEIQVADLAVRIARLERDNRRLRSLALLSLTALAGLGVMAPSAQEKKSGTATATAAAADVLNEVTAKRFVLVDANGDTRATLETRNMGWPYLSRASLTLYSKDKSRKAVIACDDFLNQVAVENYQSGVGTKSAQMQVGTEGVGLELSEYTLSNASHNMFAVSWGADESLATPKLEILKSKPGASVQIVPTNPPRVQLTNSGNQQRSYSLR